MYPAVKKVVACSDYILAVDFDNGESRSLDMKPYLEFGVFKRLKNPESFNQVRVSFDTVDWPAGVDLDPEFVYSKSIVVESLPSK
ncbi:MAG: DUF2442 domain-containing protein [Gammaproteobacteria bacterium]|nr:DUF2442 domain-containing protein [Gammaproteobacteria bacterium]MDP2141962.1 DUF2442 domain-containing protein [Gammaproteobacteria bacterium]MDP2347156.1 DUF2442 domain-containing protein [Gammaproteobacteria bacterium]